MQAVLSAAAVYLILMLLFRLTGKRTLAQVTTFDLVLLLIISEATQQALIGEDFSVTQAFIVITTLIALERGSDYLSWRFAGFRRWSESVPVVLVLTRAPRRRLNCAITGLHATTSCPPAVSSMACAVSRRSSGQCWRVRGRSASCRGRTRREYARGPRG